MILAEKSFGNSILGNYVSASLTAFFRGVGNDKYLYGFIAIYAIIAAIIVTTVSDPSSKILRIYLHVWITNYGIIFPLVFAGLGAIRIIHRLDNRRKLAFMHMFSARRVGRFLAGTALFVGLLVFTTSFTALKNAASIGVPFSWDVQLAALDNFLHFGHDPWRILYGFSQNKHFLRVVEINYNVLWFVLNYSMLYWVAVSPAADRIRWRYMLCFLLIWSGLGTVVGPLFLSAGPAFYGFVTQDVARFGDQLAFLASSEGEFSSVTDYQKYLWQLNQSKRASFGSGILAFPSIHVGFVTLNALFIREFSRKLGYFAFAYVGFILFSSVYLAWHYAVDGYFSIIAVTVLYAVTKGGLLRNKRNLPSYARRSRV